MHTLFRVAVTLLVMLGLGLSGAGAAAGLLPIIDLHFHPGPHLATSTVEWQAQRIVRLFDDLGVARANAMGVNGSDRAVLDWVGAHSGRLIPFAANDPIRIFIRCDTERTFRIENPEVSEYLRQLEGDLREGRFHGIGELVANNTYSRAASFLSKYPADSVLMRRLWEMSARYGVPLLVHLDSTTESIAEMERLLASDRRGIWIWAHTGWFAPTSLVRQLLRRHPNLYSELSNRESIARRIRGAPIDDGGVLKPAWRELIEELPDRFVIGTDTENLAQYPMLIGYWRMILNHLSPGTAAKLAHRNAERLLRLSR